MINKKVKLGIYKHYKNPDHEYQVLGTVWDTDEKDWKVLYKALYNIPELGGFGILFVRSLEVFESNIIIKGKSVKRFSFVK